MVIHRTDELYHHGILGQKWGIRRYQNKDGTLTEEGKKRYMTSDGQLNAEGKKLMAKYKLNHTYASFDKAKDKRIGGKSYSKRVQKLVEKKNYSKSAARGRAMAEKILKRAAITTVASVLALDFVTGGGVKKGIEKGINDAKERRNRAKNSIKITQNHYYDPIDVTGIVRATVERADVMRTPVSRIKF